jgi:hypothetical protein
VREVLTVQIQFLALLLLRAVVKAAFLVLQMVPLEVLEAVVLMQVLLLELAVRELQDKALPEEMELLLSVEVRAVEVREVLAVMFLLRRHLYLEMVVLEWYPP